MGIIAVTDNDEKFAQHIAQDISELAWSLRSDFLAKPTPVREAIWEAMRADEGTYVLADIGDNPGGGGPCDGTVLLKALIEMNAQNTVLAVMTDPAAVKKAIAAGVGKQVTMRLGARIDKLHGAPITVTGTVKMISDGKFMPTGPMARGLEADMGKTVVLRVGGIDVIITEQRIQPTTLALYRSLGIEPSEKRIVAVKSSVHYRASHTSIAKNIIEVDTPGVTSPRLAGLPFKHLKRPIFPLDAKTLGIFELKNMKEE